MLNNINKVKNINKEFIKFCFVGGLTFIIDYGLLFAITEYLHINYLTSSAISFSIAVIINYILCIKFVFNNGKNGYRQICLFILSSVAGLGINQLCMYFFVEILAIYYLIAKILATVIVTLWNYITKKKSVELN